MKNCINCNVEIMDETNFCDFCGVNQTTKRNASNSSSITVLCILTIVGSVFTMWRGLLYEAVAGVADNDEFIRGWIYIISSIGTIVGAIFMLNKKINGLYIYTFSQVIYLITVVYATIIYVEDFGGFALIISSMFFVPSACFLIVYWSKNMQKQLS